MDDMSTIEEWGRASTGYFKILGVYKFLVSDRIYIYIYIDVNRRL